MRKSVKKQQSQIQMIQSIVTSRKVKDDGNTNKSWKGSCWFCWVTFCLFLQVESRKRLFGKLHLCLSIQTQSSSNRPSVLHSLHALLVVVLAIPANSSAQANYAQSAKHTVNYLSHVFFLTRTHLY